MRIVAVDAPGLERAIHDEVVAGAADVVHDLFAAILLKRFAHARADGFKHFIPTGARPLAGTAGAGALHGIEDAIGIVNLIDGRGAFGAEAAAAGRMFGIALEFLDLARFLVGIGEQAAGGFAVEANGGDDLKMFFDAAGPGIGIELDPVVPLFDGRAGSEMAAVAFEIGHW